MWIYYLLVCDIINNDKSIDVSENIDSVLYAYKYTLYIYVYGCIYFVCNIYLCECI